MADSLTYTQLAENDITSKLPEIAYRQYQLAEQKKKTADKEHDDLISLFKYTTEGFNPDIAGFQKGYEAIFREGSNIALKQGYAPAKQYVQTQKDLLEGFQKMSLAQKEKSTLLYKDLSDKKKWNQDKEGYATSMANYKKYVMSEEPTKEDYDAIRQKYGISSAIPNESLRSLIRQNSFGEGEDILKYEPIGDYRKTVKEWQIKPKTTEKSTGEYELTKGSGNLYHGTKTIKEYDKSALGQQISDFFLYGKTDTEAPVYKAVAQELKATGAIPQDTDIATSEGLTKVYEEWRKKPSTAEMFKTEAESTTISEAEVSKRDSYGWGGGGYSTKNAMLTPAVEQSSGYGGIVKEKPVVYIKLTEGQNTFTMPTQGNGWVWDGSEWKKKDLSTQTIVRDPVIKYQEKIGEQGGDFYLVGDKDFNLDGSKRTTQVAIRIRNNVAAIANELRTDTKSVNEIINNAIDIHNEKYPNEKIPKYVAGESKTIKTVKTNSNYSKYKRKP